MLRSEQELSKLKFSLSEFNSDPNFVEKTIKSHLRSIIYHNLSKVRALYKIVFQIDLFGLVSKAEVDLLHKAVDLRHDCVHVIAKEISFWYSRKTTFSKLPTC